MRQLLIFALLASGCVTERSAEFQPIYGPPAPSSAPGALTTTAPSPTAPIIQQERCPPGEDAAQGRPGRLQAEAGVFGTMPDSLGIPQDPRVYSRTGCEPAH